MLRKLDAWFGEGRGSDRLPGFQSCLPPFAPSSQSCRSLRNSSGSRTPMWKTSTPALLGGAGQAGAGRGRPGRLGEDRRLAQASGCG